MTLLATLRPPPSSPPRPGRPAVDLAALSALVLRDDGARVLQSAPARIEIAIDVATGQNLAVTLRAREVRVEAPLTGSTRRYDEEHGTWIDDDEDSDLEDAAVALVESVQALTGWHVESKRLLGFDPSGACPHCQIECFEWQDRCSACDAELESVETPEDDADRRADRLLEALLREGLLELATKIAAKSVQSILAAHLANGWSSPAQLLDMLTERKEVAEVYADEADIARLLK